MGRTASVAAAAGSVGRGARWRGIKHGANERGMTQPSGPPYGPPGSDRIGPGMRLADRYDVHEPVGYGGMSSVYRGVDRLLDRDVAIKVMNAQLGGNDADRAAFLRE